MSRDEMLNKLKSIAEPFVSLTGFSDGVVCDLAQDDKNPQKTKLTEAYLFESTHGDVGGPTKKRNKKRNQAGLHWMVHQAQKSGVKMKDVPVNYIVIKEN